MKNSAVIFSLCMILALAGCNLPGGQTTQPSSPEAVFTEAAQTVIAQLTAVALQASPTPVIPTNTDTPAYTDTPVPTSTPISTVTKTPIPCLLVGFNNATIDVTVPDNTIMLPGQLFIKTWRLKNIGTCTWNSSYQLVFDHQDGMGVPASYAQTLTAGTVAPGQEVDVSVNLTAPATSGTYTGYWRFRDPNGVYFGIGGSAAWVVKIKVVNTTTVTLAPVVGESGTIRSDSGPWTDYTAGESNADITITCQTFLSYDITGIPANATIVEIKFNFKDFTVVGNPFGLGVLNAYVTDYGLTLTPSDFVSGYPPGNIADWGSTTALTVVEASPELKTALQGKLGTTRLQLRLQFPGSNGDAVKDRITFTNPTLIVKYTTP